jgi:hypothetical protein
MGCIAYLVLRDKISEMKILLDVKIEPAAVTGFIKVTKITGELCCDAFGAFCGIVNVTEEKPELIKIP